MVQFTILSGRNVGSVHLVQQFPFSIGRDASAELRLEEPGVWDRHLKVELKAGEAVLATVLAGCLATINGQVFQETKLHNGDVLEFGGAKLQFWLIPTRQRSSKIAERLTWLALAVLCLAQVVLIYTLLR